MTSNKQDTKMTIKMSQATSSLVYLLMITHLLIYPAAECARLQDSNLLINQPSQLATTELNRTQPTLILRQPLSSTIPLVASPSISSPILVATTAPNNRQSTSSLTTNQSGLSNVRSRWRLMELSLTSSLQSYSVHLKSILGGLTADSNQTTTSGGPSATCKASLYELLDGLAESRLWATQMLDSSARLIPVGLLEGTLTELGNFDECLAISYLSGVDQTRKQTRRQSSTTTTTTGMTTMNGQYCSVQIRPALISRPRLHTACRKLPSLSAAATATTATAATTTTTANNQTIFRWLSQNSQQFYYAGLRLGLCLPSKCSPSDVQHLLSSFLAKYELVGLVKSCQQQPQSPSQLLIKQTSGKTMGVDQSSAGLLADLTYYLDVIPATTHQLDHAQQVILLLFVLLFAFTLTGTLLDNQRERAHQAKLVSQHQMEQQRHNAQVNNHHHHCRQQYQVYCGGGGSSSGSPYDSSMALNPSQVNSPGLQQNPLSDEHCFSLQVEDGGPHLASDQPAGHQQHQNKRPQPLPPLVNLNGDGGEGRAARKQRPTAISTQRTGHQQAADKEQVNGSLSSCVAECGLLRSILICFSVKSNLRTIGKLSSQSSTTTTTTQPTISHQQLNGCCCNHATGNSRQTTANSNGVSNADSNMADVKVIHGLRTLAMIWIIFGHTIGLVNPEMMNNLFPLANLSCSSRLLQALLNATLAVNTFFMISGLVTVISFARKCNSALALIRPPTTNVSHHHHDGHDRKKGLSCPAIKTRDTKQPQERHRRKHQTSSSGCSSEETIEVSSIDSSSSTSVITSLGSSASLNRCAPLKQPDDHQHQQATSGGWPGDFQPLVWMLMRYLRLTPSYVAIIGCSILLPALGSGPFWSESVQPMGATCRVNWMFNLLYVNNFIETDKLCLIHSWYLSNDWQFFLLALLLFAIFYKSKKAAIVVIVALIVASSAATFAITVENDFPPTIVTTSPAVAERWLFIHSLYYKPWPHLASYLVGLLVGYLILVKDRCQMAAGWRLTCWTLFTLLAVAILNSIYPWNVGLQVDPIITGLHSATFRTLWAACCGWLVFALVSKPKSSLSLLLSWHGFQVTSRLTYCAYLVHPLIITYHFGALRERMDSSMYGQLHRFMATLALSYLFALLLSLLVECPSIKLQQLIVATVTKRRSTSIETTHTDMDFSWPTGKQHVTKLMNSSTSTTSSSSSSTTSISNGHNNSEEPIRLMMMMNEARGSQCGLDEGEFNFNLINHNRHLQNSSQPKAAAAAIPSSSPIDEDFQRKLAQAIGRGFKIRSKIVNGSLTRQPNGAVGQSPRRFGAAKRLPATSRANLAPIFANRDNKTQQQQPTSMLVGQQEDLSILNKFHRRGEAQCSTFVGPNTNQPVSHGCSSSSSSSTDPLMTTTTTTATPNPIDLNEMLLIGKQKLQSRPQTSTKN